MEPEVEVMNDEKIDAAHPQPHLRLLVGAHESVVAIVMLMIEAQASGPGTRVKRVRVDRRKEPAPELGREHEFRPRLRIEEALAADLAQPSAVIRRCVEVAYPDVPGG